MGVKLRDLGVVREIGKRIIYYFKSNEEGYLCLYKCRLDGRKTKPSEFIMNTGITHDKNILSWYYVKTNPDGTLAMYKTNRTFVPPGVSWGKSRKTKLKESKLKEETQNESNIQNT